MVMTQTERLASLEELKHVVLSVFTIANEDDANNLYASLVDINSVSSIYDFIVHDASVIDAFTIYKDPADHTKGSKPISKIHASLIHCFAAFTRFLMSKSGDPTLKHDDIMNLTVQAFNAFRLGR